jgi:hypothetical protein
LPEVREETPDREMVEPPAARGEVDEQVPYETLTDKTVRMVRFLGNQFSTNNTDSLSFNNIVQVRDFSAPFCACFSLAIGQEAHHRGWLVLPVVGA